MLSSVQRKVLERAAGGELIISQPGSFHVCYSPAHWERDDTIVNKKVLDNLLAEGFLDAEGDGHFNSTLTHEITEQGRIALTT